jgi:hypothetical protein
MEQSYVLNRSSMEDMESLSNSIIIDLLEQQGVEDVADPH